VDRFTLATAATTGTEYTDGQAAPVDLGAVTAPSASIVLHVRNLGTRALAALTATIDGTNASEFSYVFGSTSVPIGGTTTLTITGISVFETKTAAIHVSATGVTNAFDLNLTKTAAVPAGFSLIPSGAFTMGRTSGDTDTDAPPVTVTVSAFAMQQTETTKQQWDDVRSWALANGYTDLAAGAGKAASHPVQTVSWWDVVKWCNARSEKEGLTPCYTAAGAVMKTGTTVPAVNWAANGYRLPTEAEWEKAARGGVAAKRYPWGTETISHAQANYKVAGVNVPVPVGFGMTINLTEKVYSYDMAPRPSPLTWPDFYHPLYTEAGEPYTSPVASLGANGYGLYDMAGNVFEWCLDWYGASSYVGGASDPLGALTGSNRVLRGGSWDFNANVARCSNRSSFSPGVTSFSYGFRPARGRP
jgi:formylglycine-generating enzyme required for sulfatase activity